MNEIPKLHKEGPMEEKIRLAWEEAKKVGTFHAIQEGRKLGVPEEELDKFTQEIIDKEIKNEDWGFVYRIRKSLGIGNVEDTNVTLVDFFKAQGYEIPTIIPIRFKPKSKAEE